MEIINKIIQKQIINSNINVKIRHKIQILQLKPNKIWKAIIMINIKEILRIKFSLERKKTILYQNQIKRKLDNFQIKFQRESNKFLMEKWMMKTVA